jgi:Tfp pilus assembly protein PilN
MPQQVNLCLPILRKQKSRFAAQTLAQALALLLLVGGALSAAWVWNLTLASDSLKLTMAAQTKELEGLRAALEQTRANAGPAEAAMALQVQQRKLELHQREKVLAALGQGLFTPGQGHAARLDLIARTVPAVAWITQIKADDHHLEVAGYTLEPAALNEWVGKLVASPLLQGQVLSTVKLENVMQDGSLASTENPALLPPQTSAAPLSMPLTTNASAVQPPPRWAFSLVSTMAAPVVVQTPAGVKP